MTHDEFLADLAVVAEASRPDLRHIAVQTFAAQTVNGGRPAALKLFGSAAIGNAARQGRPALAFKGA
mgnify:CR=1 FL=1